MVDGAGQIWDIVANSGIDLELTYLSPPISAPATPPLAPSSGPYSIVNKLAGATQEATVFGGTIFDVSTYPAVQPAVSDIYLLNYMTGEVAINPSSGFSLVPGGSLILKDYSTTGGLWKEVAKTLIGDPFDTITYPGYKAAGIYLGVDLPTIVNITFNIAIMVESGYVESTFYADVKDEVMAYVNNLDIGDDIYLSEIIKLIKLKEGIRDVNIVSPTTNVVVLPGSMARTTSTLITVT
jgi:hypothetical protein